jgi:tetratricopeptide (TPR) repeat protein
MVLRARGTFSARSEGADIRTIICHAASMSNSADVSRADGISPVLRFIPLALIALVFLLYSPTLPYEFLDWDDYINITFHARFLRFQWEDVLWMMKDSPLGDYKPVVWLSYGLDRWIWGIRPEGFRLTNIVLHGLNTVLIYLLGIRIARRFGANKAQSWMPAVLVAALFAVHPQRVESVVWISERKDVLYAFFYLAATLVYVDMPEEKRLFGRLLLIYVLGVLAMFSKSAAVTLPLTLLLLAFLPREGMTPGQVSFRVLMRRGLEMVPLFLCALWIGLRAVQDHHPDPTALAARIEQDPTISMMIIRSPWIFGQAAMFNMVRTFAPCPLSPLYPGWSDPGLGARILLLGVGLALGVILVLLWRRGHRWPALCFGWYILSIFPSLPIRYPADRYTYVPALGLLALAVSAWWVLFRRSGRTPLRTVLLGLAIAVVGSGAIASLNYFPAWRDSVSLWERAVEYSPEAKSYRGLAVAQMRVDQLDEAEQMILKALEASPGFARAHSILGEIYLRQGRTGEAVRALERAVALQNNLAVAWLNLGTAHAIKGQMDDAVRCWQRGLELDPLSLTAVMNLGRVMMARGRSAEARAYYRRALEIQPDNADARIALAAMDGETAPLTGGMNRAK